MLTSPYMGIAGMAIFGQSRWEDVKAGVTKVTVTANEIKNIVTH